MIRSNGGYTSWRYWLVFSLTSSGGLHGLPWIIASSVPLSNATSIDSLGTDSMCLTSSVLHSIPLIVACFAVMTFTTTGEKSTQSCSSNPLAASSSGTVYRDEYSMSLGESYNEISKKVASRGKTLGGKNKTGIVEPRIMGRLRKRVTTCTVSGPQVKNPRPVPPPQEEVTPQPRRQVLEAPEPLVELLARADGRVLLIPVVCVREALELGVGHVAFSRARHMVRCVCVCMCVCVYSR